MMKHTPGPWEGCSPFVVMLDGGIPRTICKVGGQEEDSINYKCHSASRENTANVRLIAAAPDLLEACREAFVEIDYLHEKFEPWSGEAVLSRLRAAIAKAEGR